MNAYVETREDLIASGQGLVRSLAKKIWRKLPERVELDDLIAYGQTGLLEAARAYDPNRATKFTTFAYYRIQGGIWDGVSKMGWLPRHRYRQLKYEAAANEVLQANSHDGTAASPETLTDNCRWLRDVTDQLAVVFLFSQSGSEGVRGEAELESRDPAPSTSLESCEIVQKLQKLISTLPEREARLIRRMYYDGWTLTEAANELGISKSWACKMHQGTLKNLADLLRKNDLD